MKREKEEKIKDLRKKFQAIQVEAVEGSLHIKQRGMKMQYYHQIDSSGKRQRRYIPVDKIDLARQLAQQSYNRSIERLLSSKAKDLSLSELNRALDEIYLALCPARRALVRPIQETLEDKLMAWKNRSYQGRAFRPEDPVIVTEKGERVRSKTEKILADRFAKRGIDYKYECPLVLEGEKTFYPDFTFFDPAGNREIYWEHHGLIGDSDYMRKTVLKIRAYERGGIRLGERLLVTFEGAGLGVDYDRVDGLIEEVLIPLIPPKKNDRQGEVP